MRDIKFACPLCSQAIEAPQELAGQLVDCPTCKQTIEVPWRSAEAGAPPTMPLRPPAVAEAPSLAAAPHAASSRAHNETGRPASRAGEPSRQGALIGSLVCLVVGIVFMFLSLGWFFVYGPVFLASFALAIVAIAQRRIAAGICMLLLTLVAPAVTFVCLFAFRSSTPARLADSPSTSRSAIEIVQWDVSFKDSRSTGSVLANWKFHLRNRLERPQVGQLWLHGYDKEGFECYQNVYEILTTIPAGGELKKIEEAFFEPGVYEKIDKFRIIWK